MKRIHAGLGGTLTTVALIFLLAAPTLLFAGDGDRRYHFGSRWRSAPSQVLFNGTPDGDVFLDCCSQFDDSFIFRYNRVDGLFLGLRKGREEFRRRGGLQVFGGAGVAFDSGNFQYHGVVERSFFPINGQFAMGAEFFDLTYTEDEWVIQNWENTLGAILIREDFQDYYRREGFGVYISQNITRKAKLKFGYVEEKHRDLRNETNWSVFGGGKRFRLNPFIQLADSLQRGVYGTFQIDTRGRRPYSRQGWLLSAYGEYFGSEFEGASDFRRYIFEIRRFQPLSRGENVNIRLRAGETVGSVPVQKLFDLGGISTLRGYNYKSFTGDRMLLGNIEYQIDWDRLNWSPSIPVVDEFNLILFADAGVAWFKSDKGFKDLVSGDFRADVGVAIANSDGSFRINFAKRTDRSKDALLVTFRISRPF